MKLSRAEKLADKVIKRLESCWEIASYGGSLRRKRPNVNDIEIICVPHRFVEETEDFNWVLGELEFFRKIKILKNGEKYKQFWLTKKDGAEIIKVDMFIVTPPASFGVIHVIRTGSAAFSKWLVNCRKDKGFQFQKGALFRNDIHISTPSELSVFEALQLEFIPPEKRNAPFKFQKLKKKWVGE